MIYEERRTLISAPHNGEGNTMPAVHGTQHLIAIDKDLYGLLRNALAKDTETVISILEHLADPEVGAVDFQAHLKPITWRSGAQRPGAGG